MTETSGGEACVVYTRASMSASRVSLGAPARRLIRVDEGGASRPACNQNASPERLDDAVLNLSSASRLSLLSGRDARHVPWRRYARDTSDVRFALARAAAGWKQRPIRLRAAAAELENVLL